MSPPQLPRDAPVVDVIHPVQVHLPVIVRNNGDLAAFHCGDGLLRQRLDLDKPLRRKSRLNDRPRAVALAERNRVVFRAHEESLLGEVLHHALARRKALQSRIRTGVRVHLVVLVDHFDLRQVVPQSCLEVIRIMRRRHLHRARAELRLRQLVGDDRNLAFHQRQQHFLPVQMRVALIASIHRNRRIAQHRLRTRSSHGDEFFRPHHRISNLVQLPRHVLVLHLEVRDCRPAVRAPVHDVLPAVDQSFFI